MQVVETIEALRAARRMLPGSVGLVPTMGALHEGHLSLVQQAKAENNVVIVTIFVNPTQFAANEDLAAYPRDLPHDLAMLEGLGIDLVFTPTPALIYPQGYQTYVEVETISQGLEGAHRPGHFRGVATVVAKLFNMTQPDKAYFGQKDAQQVAVIKAMARDLNFPLDVVVCPIKREDDGLAMSSRNTYLDPIQRQAAIILYKALVAASDAYDDGEREPTALRQVMRKVLMGESLADVEYISVSDVNTLRELESAVSTPLLLSMAVKIGQTRLIDNMLLPLALNQSNMLSAILGSG
ncbi:MAG: pantoate--beta-alanine ligase [Chitinophagaceae bacterium]|nr:pantoate--beta-alanine ligase [Anaerolineae bacterium]